MKTSTKTTTTVTASWTCGLLLLLLTAVAVPCRAFSLVPRRPTSQVPFAWVSRPLHPSSVSPSLSSATHLSSTAQRRHHDKVQSKSWRGSALVTFLFRRRKSLLLALALLQAAPSHATATSAVGMLSHTMDLPPLSQVTTTSSYSARAATTASQSIWSKLWPAIQAKKRVGLVVLLLALLLWWLKNRSNHKTFFKAPPQSSSSSSSLQSLQRVASNGSGSSTKPKKKGDVVDNEDDMDDFLNSLDVQGVRSDFDKVREINQGRETQLKQAQSLLSTIQDSVQANKTPGLSEYATTKRSTPTIDDRKDDDSNKKSGSLMDKLSAGQGDRPKEREQKARLMVQNVLNQVDEAKKQAQDFVVNKDALQKDLVDTKMLSATEKEEKVDLPPPLEETEFADWKNAMKDSYQPPPLPELEEDIFFATEQPAATTKSTVEQTMTSTSGSVVESLSMAAGAVATATAKTTPTKEPSSASATTTTKTSTPQDDALERAFSKMGGSVPSGSAQVSPQKVPPLPTIDPSELPQTKTSRSASPALKDIQSSSSSAQEKTSDTKKATQSTTSSGSSSNKAFGKSAAELEKARLEHKKEQEAQAAKKPTHEKEKYEAKREREAAKKTDSAAEKAKAEREKAAAHAKAVADKAKAEQEKKAAKAAAEKEKAEQERIAAAVKAKEEQERAAAAALAVKAKEEQEKAAAFAEKAKAEQELAAKAAAAEKVKAEQVKAGAPKSGAKTPVESAMEEARAMAAKARAEKASSASASSQSSSSDDEGSSNSMATRSFPSQFENPMQRKFDDIGEYAYQVLKDLGMV